MALFLGFGFPLFGFCLACYLFSWERIFSSLIFGFLGLLSFLLAWFSIYLLKGFYRSLLGYELLNSYTILDFFFQSSLLLYVPLFLISYWKFRLVSTFSRRKEKFSSLYFWFAGFFSSFCIYILFQASARYSAFEYILLPFLFMSFFCTLICILPQIYNFASVLQFFSLFLITTFFSLPTVFWQALYFKTFYGVYTLCLLSGLLCLVPLLRFKFVSQL